MEKNINYYYSLYYYEDEDIYDELSIHTIKELEKECDKDLVKYYGFKCWLEDMEEYYFDKKMNPEYL